MNQFTLRSSLLMLIAGCAVVPPMYEPPASHPASAQAVESPVPPRPVVLRPAASAVDETPLGHPDEQPPQPQAPTHDHSPSGDAL